MASELTSGNITFSGLGNGTDFNSLIDGLVEAERFRINRLEVWKMSWEDKVDALQELNTKLLSLSSTLEGMDTMNKFLVKNATSTNSTALSVTADADAEEGTNTIEVGQLATNDIHINNNGEAALDDILVTSNTTLVINYSDSDVITLSVSANTTLQGLVNQINNNADARGKVRAGTIYDGSEYHLQLWGMNMGSNAQVQIASSGIPDYQSTDFAETQNASNAKIKVNGYPPGTDEWIERYSNSINDVIDGLTLNLKETTTPSTVKVTVTTDTGEIKDNIQTFVDQINEVRTLVKDLTKFDDNTQTGSVMTGNYGVQMISQQLKDIIADKGLGFLYYDSDNNVGDRYSALPQLGILTDAQEGSATEGLLVIDDEALDAALADDPESVAELFAANYIGTTWNSDFSYVSHVPDLTQAGEYKVQYTISGGAITSATINGQSATINGWEITAVGDADNPAKGMVLRVDNHADGTYGNSTNDWENKAYLKLGKTKQLESAIREITRIGVSSQVGNTTYVTKGSIQILEDGYETIIDNIDLKIEREENRILLLERNMRNRFARLDALLGTYNSMSQQLASQINQLPTV